MNPAVIAQQLGFVSAGGVPAWLPAGAVTHLDFVDGNYYAGGAERVLTGLIGSFDLGDLDAGGWALPRSSLGYTPKAAGAFFDDLAAYLAAGFTMVCEFQLDDLFHMGQVVPQISFDSGSAMWLGDEHLALYFTKVDALMQDYYDLNIAHGGSDSTDDWVDLAINKIAMNVNRDIGGGDYEAALSVNGGTIDSQIVDYDIQAKFDASTYGAVQTITLFEDLPNGWTDGDLHIRKITLYPAKDKTELIGLST